MKAQDASSLSSDTIAAEVAVGVASANIATARDITHTGLGAATNPSEGVFSVPDTFDFSTAASATIENFEDGTDLINISTIETFAALTFAALTGASGSTQILVAEGAGNTTLDIDIDDDGASDMTITLPGVTGLTIDASDFII